MKLKHILAIAVLITQSIVAQNTKVKDKATNIILKVGVARGFRFSPTPPARSLEVAQISTNLAKGTTYDFGLYYRINNNVALGFKYNWFNANSLTINLYDTISSYTALQNDVISFYGASFLFDHKSNQIARGTNLILNL